MSKFIVPLLLFIPTLSTPSAAKMLYYDLKGITAVNYHAYVVQDSNRCRVERDSFETALQLVANQSVKLKPIPFHEWIVQNRELHDIQQQIWDDLTRSGKPEDMSAATDNAKYKAAKQLAFDYGIMPMLNLHVMPMETVGGCVAMVNATLDAYLDYKSKGPLEILPNHRRIMPATIEIWSTRNLITSSSDGFANYATRAAEGVLKELVNDWTAAQELEDLFVSPRQ
jgi:hypothetical protein